MTPGSFSGGVILPYDTCIPTDPLFFKKGKKKKKKKKKGVVFRWLVAATPFFFATLRKDGRGLVIVRRPTDLPVERDSRDTGNKVFLLVGLS